MPSRHRRPASPVRERFRRRTAYTCAHPAVTIGLSEDDAYVLLGLLAPYPTSRTTRRIRAALVRSLRPRLSR